MLASPAWTISMLVSAWSSCAPGFATSRFSSGSDLGYCLVMEPSPTQGTLGKRLVGIKVVDQHGRRLSFSRALARTTTKLTSYGALGLGFLWIAFTKSRQGWHDQAAKTFVVRGSSADHEQNPVDEFAA